MTRYEEGRGWREGASERRTIASRRDLGFLRGNRLRWRLSRHCLSGL